MKKRSHLIHLLAVVGLLCAAIGTYFGLFVAPPDRNQGEVVRILYVHVPSAWIMMVCFTLAFGFAIWSLWSGDTQADGLMVGSIEVGTMLTGLVLVQGMLWARPTWGVWWDWDVRLTFTLILFLLFAGILALRAVVDDRGRRATWSAVATIVAYADVPLVYYCVRWWRSLHQVQSSPETVDPMMLIPLRLNALAVLFLSLWMIALRARVEKAKVAREEIDVPERIPLEGSVGHA